MINKKYIYGIAILFGIIFVGMAGYLSYFSIAKKNTIATHPYNKRLDHLEDEVIRGNIYDASGKLLATTIQDQRQYPLKRTYAHVVGYSTRGKYGMEALANTQLLYPDYNFPAIIRHAFYEEKFVGRDVVLTIENTLQQAAAEALGDNKGAVVVMEPTTGKIKAMYSSPSFDPNNVAIKWEELSSDTQNSPLLNRATQGLYPPGSIFKVFPAIGLIEAFPNDYLDVTYECKGTIQQGDYTISCYDKTAHGKVNLEKAFTVSCNTFFVHLSDVIGPTQLGSTAESLLFNSSLPSDIESKKSRIKLAKTNKDFSTLAAYIGQGEVVVTPLHMCLVTSIIVNDGVLMRPYILSEITNQQGKIFSKQMPKYEGAYLNESICAILKDMMLKVVGEGTATKVQTKGLTVGGKTGTAQNETALDHSWFIGFAQHKENPKDIITFAVIVENGGKGSKALDVTKKLLQAYKELEVSS